MAKKRDEAFVNEYFLCNLNATEAARRMGYKHPNVQGPRLLVKDSVKAEINRRLEEKQMSADEALARLGDMARSDIAGFAEIERASDLQKEEYRGETHVIKKFKRSTIHTKKGDVIETVELELYDAQAAIVNILKIHGKFVEKVEQSGELIFKVIHDDTGDGNKDSST